MIKKLLAVTAATSACGFLVLRGQQPAPAVFTAAQAEAGRSAVQGICVNCHTNQLTGRTGDPSETPPLSSIPANNQMDIKTAGGKVPPLVGPAFLKRWGLKTTADLSKRVQDTLGFLPADQRDERMALNLTAFILQSNGAQPGPQELTMSSAAGIGSLTVR